MEDEFDYTYENDTEIYSRPISYVVHDYLILVSLGVGIIFCALIIYVIWRNKRMQSRTNLLVLNWAILELFGLCSVPTLIRRVLYMTISELPSEVRCSLTCIDVTVQFASLFVLFALLSYRKPEIKKLSTVLKILYGITAAILILGTILCGVLDDDMHLVAIFMLMALVSVILLITLLVKEVMRCRSKTALSEADNFRLNLCRIYIYNWTLCAVTLIFGYPIALVSVSGYLTSLYFVIYMAFEKNYKICFLNIFRNSEKYNVDATISFADECDQVDNDPTVNIDFNNAHNNKPT